MSDRPSFVAALAELEDEREQERMRPGAVHRIARRLDAELLEQELPTKRRTWIPMASFAAGAAMVLAVFTLGGDSEVAERQDKADTPMHASWQIGGDNCHTTHGETEIVFDGRCRVVAPEPGMVVDSRATTRVRAIEHGMALVEGAAIFEVEPRTEGPRRRVEVPGGSIEIMGTRFSVVVYGDHGHVDLLEGSIHFVGHAGDVHEITPGQRFRFSSNPQVTAAAVPTPMPGLAVAPTTPEAEPEPDGGDTDDAPPLAAGELLAGLVDDEPSDPGASTSASPNRSRTARRDAALRKIVDEVTELRAQRKYPQAAKLLREAIDDSRWTQHTREVLSYELGTILSTQLSDTDAACAHWQRHEKRFSAGRYARAVERTQARLGCE